MGYFADRKAETGIDCPECGQKLLVERGCRHVRLHCPHCRKDYDMKRYLGSGDEKLESFLENVYVDRI